MFPWLKEDPLVKDSCGQAIPEQQRAARASQFNSAAAIEDAMKQKFMEDFAKEQQYEEEKQRFLQYKLQREKEHHAAAAAAAATAEQGGSAQQQQQQQQLPSGAQVDWGGFIVPADRRKVYHDHASQKQALRQENGYIVPSTINESLSGHGGATRNTKKHFENDQSFQTRDSNAESLPHRSATYQRGPGTSHDTSHWQTSTQSLYKGEIAGDGRGFLPSDKVGRRKKFKPAFEQASSQRKNIHQQPLRELGQNPNGHYSTETNHHHQHGSMTTSMQPRVDMSHAGGTGMRSREGQLLSGNALTSLAASVARVVPRPQAVLKPKSNGYDKLNDSLGTAHHGHMPGTTVRQQRSSTRPY